MVGRIHGLDILWRPLALLVLSLETPVVFPSLHSSLPGTYVDDNKKANGSPRHVCIYTKLYISILLIYYRVARFPIPACLQHWRRKMAGMTRRGNTSWWRRQPSYHDDGIDAAHHQVRDDHRMLAAKDFRHSVEMNFPCTTKYNVSLPPTTVTNVPGVNIVRPAHERPVHATVVGQ